MDLNIYTWYTSTNKKVTMTIPFYSKKTADIMFEDWVNGGGDDKPTHWTYERKKVKEGQMILSEHTTNKVLTSKILLKLKKESKKRGIVVSG